MTPVCAQAGLLVDPSASDFYQFGVWQGFSLAGMRKAPWTAGMNGWGLDTFTGLPSSAQEPGGQKRMWNEGHFRIKDTVRSLRHTGSMQSLHWPAGALGSGSLSK